MLAINGNLGAGDYDRVELNGFTDELTDVTDVTDGGRSRDMWWECPPVKC